MPSRQQTIAARCHRSGLLADGAANGAIQRQQIEQTHHQFRPLREVIDRLSEKRMDHPDQRARECDAVGRGGKSITELRGRERVPDDAEQQQRGQNV